jgi:hypothetical protein
LIVLIVLIEGGNRAPSQQRESSQVVHGSSHTFSPAKINNCAPDAYAVVRREATPPRRRSTQEVSS